MKKVTAPYKYPRLIEFAEELPKTVSGKIRRVEIRSRDRRVDYRYLLKKAQTASQVSMSLSDQLWLPPITS